MRRSLLPNRLARTQQQSDSSFANILLYIRWDASGNLSTLTVETSRVAVSCSSFTHNTAGPQKMASNPPARCCTLGTLFEYVVSMFPRVSPASLSAIRHMPTAARMHGMAGQHARAVVVILTRRAQGHAKGQAHQNRRQDRRICRDPCRRRGQGGAWNPTQPRRHWHLAEQQAFGRPVCREWLHHSRGGPVQWRSGEA